MYLSKCFLTAISHTHTYVRAVYIREMKREWTKTRRQATNHFCLIQDVSPLIPPATQSGMIFVSHLAMAEADTLQEWVVDCQRHTWFFNNYWGSHHFSIIAIFFALEGNHEFFDNLNEATTFGGYYILLIIPFCTHIIMLFFLNTIITLYPTEHQSSLTLCCT